jgi:sporulation integral membrane protein YlbJ
MYLYRVIHAKRMVLPLIAVAFITFLVIFSESSLQSARDGLNVWLNTVFPSLLPFMVASEMLRNSGFMNRLGIIFEPVMRPLFNLPGCGSFPFILGMASGYPTGAKIVSGMYKDELLTKNEAERLLVISNNASPVFIAGAVAAGIFKMPATGVLLLACHIISGIATGILLRVFMNVSKNVGKNASKNASKYACKSACGNEYKNTSVKPNGNANGKVIRKAIDPNPGKVFTNAVYSSVQTMIMIGGFIIFFAVVTNLLTETGIIEGLSIIVKPIFRIMGIPQQIIKAVLSGIIEITAGIASLGAIKGFPPEYGLTAAAFILGWGGISVHFQVYGIISEAGLGMRKFVVGKLLHGLLASFMTYMSIKLMMPAAKYPVPVFNPSGQPTVHNFTGVLLFSCFYMAAAMLIMFMFIMYPRIVAFIKKH